MNQLQQDIVALIKQNGRLSVEMIATTLGVSALDVEREMTILTQKGVLVTYSMVLDDQNSDSGEVEAWIELKVTPQRNQGYDSLAAEIAAFPQVKNLYLMSGAYDLAVTVTGNNLREVSSFVHEKLAVMDNVISTTTHFILKCYKVVGVNLIGGKKENRLPFTE
jgi:DNA-binding Lrp family transcriptional regulator